jgi:hypothetical protein
MRIAIVCGLLVGAMAVTRRRFAIRSPEKHGCGSNIHDAVMRQLQCEFDFSLPRSISVV